MKLFVKIHFLTEVMYKSIKADEYFYGCLGNNLDLALIKFNSNFEIENIDGY